MNQLPTLICITPMKNEDWILERFLKCTSTWADHIILFDQNSTDNSPEIASKFPKVHYHINPAQEFNDHNHWSGLMEEARKLPGVRKVIFSLDCDEFFSSNSFETPEWKTFLNSEPGSLMVVDRVLVSHDVTMYRYEMDTLLGFVDDGVSTIGMLGEKKKVHNIRLPFPLNCPGIFKMNQIKLLHYSLSDIGRLRSKNRWYQCFEKNVGEKSTSTILNQYHMHGLSVDYSNYKKIPIEWLNGYFKCGIDMTSMKKISIYYWWDKKILEEYFIKDGWQKFGKLNIWDIDWNGAAAHFGLVNYKQIKYTRTTKDKIYLKLFLLSKSSKSLLKRSIASILFSIINRFTD